MPASSGFKAKGNIWPLVIEGKTEQESNLKLYCLLNNSKSRNLCDSPGQWFHQRFNSTPYSPIVSIPLTGSNPTMYTKSVHLITWWLSMWALESEYPATNAMCDFHGEWHYEQCCLRIKAKTLFPVHYKKVQQKIKEYSDEDPCNHVWSYLILIFYQVWSFF